MWWYSHEGINIVINMTITIPITYGNYQPKQLRKGAGDDVVVNLHISEVISDHGAADTYIYSRELTLSSTDEQNYICMHGWLNIEAMTFEHM